MLPANREVLVRRAAILAAMLNASVAAAAGPAAGEQEYIGSLPVVLTPSRLPQQVDETPAAVTVIDRELIRATGYRDIARLLRLAPGMQVGQERGNSQWVTYHGMGNDNPSWMQVLVDGRSVYSPGNFDGVDWNALPLSQAAIERIEIVRGTNSVAFGSNALLGVINIVTRDSRDGGDGGVTLGAGDGGIADLDIETGGTSTAGGWRINASSRHDDGFAGLNDWRRQQTASLRADRNLGDGDELMLRVAASDGTRGLGYPDSLFGNNAERRATMRNATLHLQWRHSPAADDEWLVHYYRNEERTEEHWTASARLGPTLALVPLDRDRHSRRDSFELQHRQARSANLRTVWGLELRHDSIDAPFLYFGSARQAARLGRLFGQAEWWLTPELSLNGNALIENFDAERTRLSPRTFANWKLSPTTTLRAGYARAWRQPFMFERHGDVRALFQGRLLAQPYMPNPQLRPSRLDSWELGVVGHVVPLATRFDLRLFRERINDFVTRTPHPEFTAPLLAGSLPSARYENLANPVYLAGLEYQIEARPAESARLLFNHALIGRHSSSSLERKLTAPYTATLTWLQTWSGDLSSTLTLLRMGPIAGGSGFVPKSEYRAPAYTTLDARLARRLRLGTGNAELALVATNLGPRHQEIPDRSEQFLHGDNPVNRTSRTVWLTLSIGSPAP